jgi:hypothetical protein
MLRVLPSAIWIGRPPQQFGGRNLLLQLCAAVAGQIGHQRLRQTLPGLAVGISFGTARALLSDAQEGQQTGHGGPTGLIRREGLVQEHPDRHQRRVQAFAVADLMTLQGRFDLLLGQQFRQTQVLIVQHLLPVLLHAADLAGQPSLGILVHDRPPCEKIAMTTIFSAWRSILLHSYRSLACGLWKCHSGQPLF